MKKQGEEITLDLDKNRKRKKVLFNILKAIIILAIVAAIGFVIYKVLNRKYNSFEVVEAVDRKGSDIVKFITYDNDKLIKFSRDGITAIDGKGNDIWSASYEMKEPFVVTRGKYAAVADINNKRLIIYDGDGNASEVEILYPITTVDISANGIAAVVLRDEMTDYINICDGKEIFSQIKTRIAMDGYPLAITISDDAKKLVTSYTLIGEGEAENFLTFYNFGDVGQSYNNRIVRAETLDDEMVPLVKFVNEKDIVAVSDRGIRTYEMKETPSLMLDTGKLEYQIKSVMYDSGNVGVILDNYKENKKQLLVYSLEGDEKINEDLDYEYTDVNMSNSEIIFNSQKGIRIVSASGKLKFDGQCEDIIDGVYPYNGKDKYILITDKQICQIKLTERENV